MLLGTLIVLYKDYILVFFFFSSRRRHTRFKCDWSSDVCSSDLGTADVISSVEIRPETGKPEPRPLPTVMMSGVVAVCSQPNQRPVRPKPVIISSLISRASFSLAISRTIGMNSGGGTTLPAVPWTGSIRIAASAPVVEFLMTLRANWAHSMPQEG